MSSGGIAAVAARIQAIEARFAPPAAPRAVAGTAFADALAVAQGSPRAGTATGQQVVDIAKQWLGTPYVYGGNDPQRGIDCSGLVQQAFRRVGVELPRVTYDQVKQGTAVKDISQAKPGDLIFTVGDRGRRVNGHVGIYMGSGKWIEAPYTGAQVRITDIPKNITAIRRVIPDTPPLARPFAPVSLGGTIS
ncbi:MAG: C40 family peptidase [Acidimicrobiia bacterium]